MSDYLEKLLIYEEEISKSLVQRKKKYTEKSVSVTKKMTKADTLSILKQKAELEKKDGWDILRKSKKSFRLKKDKPLDEQLEDEVWTILARMGFNELSDGRFFKIKVGDDLNPRQIDVFAKDRETAIIIECTHCEEHKKKNMSNLIEKINSIRGEVVDSIKAHYSNNPKLKIGWIIASKNVEWGDADLAKLKTNRISLLRDQEIDYYVKLTDHLRGAAKYQFLSHIFRNETISGLDLSVPATKGKMGGKVFYNFLIRPSDLLKIAYISHKASRNIEDLETYQRMLKPKRLKDIAEYIDNEGQFPTNIVINIKSEKRIRFDLKENIGDSSFGTLYLPRCYASCWIIDGQHRLYGYMHSSRAKIADDQTTLPVLAYNNLSSIDEANLFVDINSKQVKVTAGLLNELYANLKVDDKNFDDRTRALRTKITFALNARYSSPLYDRIKITGKAQSIKRCLTLTSFVTGLKENRFLGQERKPGPLCDTTSKELEATINKAVDILDGYLSIFSEAMPEHWNLGNDKGGFLATNEGIRALLSVLKDILWYIEYKDRIAIDYENSEVILPYIKKYIEPVVEYFKSASEQEIANFRGIRAKAGVRKNSLLMMRQIHNKYSDFEPQGLREFLDTIDEEGTNEARSMIDDMQEKFYKITISVLKDHFGESKWWFEGIPQKIRTECVKRREEEKGIKDKEQYFVLINYRDIALHNWSLFEQYFSLVDRGSKSKRTEWLIRLNEIRNTTHHKEKWPAYKDDVQFIRDIYPKVIGKFKLTD